MSESGRGQRGFALIIVLWMVGVLALIVSGLLAAAHVDARVTAGLRNDAAGRAAADAALSQAVIEILRTGRAVSGPRRVGDVPVQISWTDLSGRLNPNIASVAMLNAFLLQLDVPERNAENLSAAIIDWRSPGEASRLGGTKAARYRDSGLGYRPPGRPFETLDEIGFVMGVTPALLAAMKPHLTLWSENDPEPSNADAVVLAALRATGVPVTGRPSTQARVIAITAAAAPLGGGMIVRRAVIKFGFSPDGRGWRILAWDDGADLSK